MSNRKVMIGFKTDIETRERLEEIAELEDRSISYIVNRIITKALDEMGDPYNTGEQALKEANYIKDLDFSSYGDFINKCIKDGRYSSIRKNLGEQSAYYLVCEKLGITPDENFASGLKK